MKFILLILFIKSINCSEISKLCANNTGIINTINNRCECIDLKLWKSCLLQLLFPVLGGGYWYNGWETSAVIITLLTLISSNIISIILFCIKLDKYADEDENNDYYEIKSISIMNLFKKILGFIIVIDLIGLIIILSNQYPTGYGCYLSPTF